MEPNDQIAGAVVGELHGVDLHAGSGAAVGTFVGAMMSRGVEHEVANFYDQALPKGDILVAAEVAAGDDATMLDRAERVFVAAGARPIALPQG